MTDLAIRAEKLGKAYQITHASSTVRYKTLQEDLIHLFRRPAAESRSETFWALKDISFDVKHGEVLGIIGRNGAGKSTLLKILSRITKPTTGHATVYGRVGSLLEVGTGFHSELTGRENIYLNGAILGMKRADIRRRFDEIVAFAEVEQFLDTPVKRYSSGMYMRLAFAVAAHLEPEILVVDEVLAVGDARFQEKSLGKMSDVAKSGRTVLFVSHNISVVTRLCTNALLLDRSRIIAQGKVHEIAALYNQLDTYTSASREWNATEVSGCTLVRPLGVYVKNRAGEISETLTVSEPIFVELHYEVCTSDYPVVPTIRLHNSTGIVFTSFDTQMTSYSDVRIAGKYKTVITIPPNLLNEGAHTLLLSINVGFPLTSHFLAPDVVAFQIVEDVNTNQLRTYYGELIPGAVRPYLDWTTNGPT